jgi:tetratricopeptide (TPR) repeat protein/predicted Ser/Thr protein kinase
VTETVGPYELVRLLGRGGMGEVHLARDTRLDREVALKLLPAELADDEERRGRLLREARAAASLNHPNITTIHDVGEAEGRDYIAQEYVEGRPLSELLAERRLPLPELAELAVPLADALAYAHERGVIHRDLKPGNVIVTPRGLAKLLDFGLAKLQRDTADDGDSQSTTLTISGAVFGTPSAMSPEQALGRAVDARSDVFSFGALLYEMAAGKPAYLGTTIQETIDKVLHAEPDPLDRLRRDLPADFIAIVSKALRKEPDERYQSMAELAADLRHFKRQTDSGLVPPGATSRGARAGGAPGLRYVAAAVLLAAAALLWWRPWETAEGGGGASPTGSDAAPAFAAVMYVENLTDPADTEHLGAMLAHLLTTELSSGGGLDMLSQQRLFETARAVGREDGSVDRTIVTEVATRAGVGTMLLGQVSRVGTTLLATVTMVDAASGADLGTARAEGAGEEDLFTMAGSLGQQVRIALTGRSDAAGDLEQQLTSSVEAYRAYVRGQEAMQHRQFGDAAEILAEATELDPAFALANFWRAIALQWSFGTGEEAALAMERSVAYRDRLPEDVRPVAEAGARYVRGQHEECLELFQEILREDPGNRVATYLLGEVRLHSSLHSDAREAARLFARALELDPGFTMVRDHLLAALVFDGRADQARAVLDGWDVDDEVERQSLLLGIAMRNGDEAQTVAHLQALEDLGESPGWVLPWDLSSSAAVERLERLAMVPGDDASQPAGGQLSRQSHLYIRVGRFEKAFEMLASLPAPEYESVYDWEANTWARQRHLEALLAEMVGDTARLSAVIEHALRVQPSSHRTLYMAARVTARGGDLEAARRHADRLDELVEQELSDMSPLYRDAARAEIALAEGRPDEARERYALAVDSGRLLADWWVDNTSFGPILREGLAEACLAAGDREAARDALRALLERRDEVSRLMPLVPIRALHSLGALEIELGDEARGRELLQRFLEHWGEADRPLEEVEDAKARLGG